MLCLTPASGSQIYHGLNFKFIKNVIQSFIIKKDLPFQNKFVFIFRVSFLKTLIFLVLNLDRNNHLDYQYPLLHYHLEAILLYGNQ